MDKQMDGEIDRGGEWSDQSFDLGNYGRCLVCDREIQSQSKQDTKDSQMAISVQHIRFTNPLCTSALYDPLPSPVISPVALMQGINQSLCGEEHHRYVAFFPSQKPKNLLHYKAAYNRRRNKRRNSVFAHV